MKNYILYVNDGCSRCEMVKRRLNEKDIKYTCINVDTVSDPTMIKEAVEKGITSYPIVFDLETNELYDASELLRRLV